MFHVSWRFAELPDSRAWSSEANSSHSACVACYRQWEPVQPNAPDAPVIHHVMHDRNFGLNFRSDLDEYIGLAFAAEQALITDVKPEVDGFGVRPISVTSIGNGFYQANFKLPPGLDPGWHDVAFRLGNSERSSPYRIAVDLPVIVERLSIRSVAENDTWTQDSVARGKSVVIWIDGLPSNVDVNNARVGLNGRPLRVTHANAGQVNAFIPDDAPEGPASISIEVGGVTATSRLTIR